MDEPTSQNRASRETVKFHLSGKCVNGLEWSATYANYRRTRAANGGGGTRSAGAVPPHAVPKVLRAPVNSSQKQEEDSDQCLLLIRSRRKPPRPIRFAGSPAFS